jgi:Domain of Unknown Function with PDB structure (DUF3857)/Transglutaminase-like superfamily
MPQCRTRAATVFAALFLLAAASPASGQSEWPPIPDEEMALKDCPQQPGAPAVFLWREVLSDDNYTRIFRHYRLKVLTPAGKDRANIEIPFVKGRFKVDDLKARVVQPDGRSEEFKGQLFEKTAVRAGGLKVKVMTFALPDVDVGSIIEYRYRLVPDEGRGASKRAQAALEEMIGAGDRPEEGGIDSEKGLLFLPVDVWDIQEDLFTRRAKFAYVPSDELEHLFSLAGFRMRLIWVFRRLEGAKPERKKGQVELELVDVPALENEEFMPPKSSQRMEVRLFYLEGRLDSFDKYWKEESENWQTGAEKFMRKAGTAADEARRVTAGLDDPVQKLRALYGRAQEIKNLSYDRTLTSRRKEELKIKDNGNVADVLKRGYGLRSDITRTFAAMARAAGFEAKVVRVSRRDDKFFDRNLGNLYGQFDAELAMVKVNGEDKLFDPSTPFCPVGLVHWSCSGSVCLVPSAEPPLFLTTPIYTAETALTQREIALALDAEGGLAGTVKVTFLGQEALVRRVAHIGDDQTEVKKDFEAEMAELLPAGAKVTMKTLENIDNNKDSVVAHFEVAIPGLATTAGGKTLLPVSPLLGSRRHPFRHAQRKHPIYFPYASREFDDIVVKLPDGMSAETVPAVRKKDQEGFSFNLLCVPEDGGKLHVQRDLVVKKCFFAADQHKTVKAFFDEITAGDEELVVLSAVKK